MADLQVARVPTTRIVRDPAARAASTGDNMVAVTVDELPASLVLGILEVQAPVMTEATLNAA